MFKHFGGNGPEREKDARGDADNETQVFLIWEECYSETGDGTKGLVAKKQD